MERNHNREEAWVDRTNIGLRVEEVSIVGDLQSSQSVNLIENLGCWEEDCLQTDSIRQGYVLVDHPAQAQACQEVWQLFLLERFVSPVLG